MGDLPPKPVDDPPDSTEPSGKCPRCGRLSNFDRVGQPLPVTLSTKQFELARSGRSEPLWDAQVSVFACPGCHQNVVVIEERFVGGVAVREGGNQHGGSIEWRGIHSWPFPGSGEAKPS
jgi:hypothetical protein